MYKLFKLNLQRFNEDIADESGTTSQQDSTVQEENVDNSKATEMKIPRIAVKDGQLVFLDDDEEIGYKGEEGTQEEEDESSKTEDIVDEQPSTEQPAQTKNDQKYVVTVRGEKIEVSLDELLGGYMRMSDYTRSKQELKALQEKALTPPQQQNNTNNNPPQTQDKKSEYLQLKKQVEARVADILGEPYNSMDDDHLAIFTQEMADTRLMMAKQREQQDKFNAVIQGYSQEPDWTEIDAFAGDVLNNLPYKVAKTIESKIQSGDAETLDQFLGLVKQEYRKSLQPQTQQQNPVVQNKPVIQQQANKPKMQTAPKVEGAGSGVESVQLQNQFDREKFGKMNNIYDKMNYLDAMGVFNAMGDLKT